MNREIVDERDSCIVAVSAGGFALQAIGMGLPVAVTAVYPFGAESYAINPQTMKLHGPMFAYSEDIDRKQDPKRPERIVESIKRTAFDCDTYKHISGLVWSRRGIGNFLGQRHDFVFVRNKAGKRPIPRRRFRYAERYWPVIGKNQVMHKKPRR